MKHIALHNGHDSSVTAFDGGEVALHLELERHLKIKHFAGVARGNEIGEALDYVLDQLRWKPSDVQNITFCSLDGWNGNWSKTEFSEVVMGHCYPNLTSSPHTAWEGYWRGVKTKFLGVSHHVNHMAYSYFTNKKTNCLLFAIDGMGDFLINATYGIGKDNHVSYLGNTTHDNPAGLPFSGFGILYSLLGELFPFLGKDPLSTAGKAMGLSSYGRPRDSWRTKVRAILLHKPDQRDEQTIWNDIKSLLRSLKQEINADIDDPHCKEVQDLMATIQDESEIYMQECISILVKKYGVEDICLSGGCALNCQANTRITRNVSSLYIPPACSDTGVSIGGGLYYWHHVMGNAFQGCEWHSPYLGEHVRLDKERMPGIFESFVHETNLPQTAAWHLAQGKIIAWAQGRSEIGPRALGNRSILAAPFPETMKQKVNLIKNREFWRPFAPVCLEEDACNWFDIDHSQPYMLECPAVKAEKSPLIPAVTHVDGTARLQTVSAKTNPLLHSLLVEFKKLTGVPVLLNTSLNDRNRPIANECSTILNLMLKSKLDMAFIGNKFYRKHLI